MIHLLLTDKFFVTAVTAIINSGLLKHKITPDQVNFNKLHAEVTVYNICDIAIAIGPMQGWVISTISCHIFFKHKLLADHVST